MADYTVQDLQDNLDYLNNTKQIIKQSIVNKGQSISDTDTFRSYADKISAIETGKGDVKLFETEEAMQADTKAEEGDLAIVYKNEVNNVTADSRFQYVTFPETVTLPTAVTTDSFCMLRAVDPSVMFNGQVQLSKTSFRFNGYSETGMTRVSYTSSDGVNYTRDTIITNPVDLGTEVLIYDVNSFTTDMGYFMQISVDTFKGLYEYDSNHISETNFGLLPISGINISEKTYTGKPLGNYNKDDINTIVKKIKTELSLNINNMTLSIGTIDSKLMITFYINSDKTSGYHTELCYDKTNSRYQIQSAWSAGGNLYVYELDTSNFTYKLLYNEITSGSSYYLNVSGNLDSLFVVATSYSDGTFEVASNSPTFIRTSENGQSSNSITFSGDDIKSILYLNDPKYILAPTQFNLTASNELLPGKIAYGKNGVVTGDDTLYDNLDAVKILTKYFGISENVAKLSYDDILSKAKEASSLPEDGCVQYINVSDFDKFNMYHLTDFSSKKNLIYLMNWKQYAIQEFQDNSSYLEKYDYTTNKTLCVGYGAGKTTRPIEVYVYNDSMVQLDHYLTTTSYASINASQMFYYNDELYIPQDTRNSTLYKFNESKNGLVEVKSGLGGFIEGLALDIDLNVIYLCIGLTTNGYFITNRIIKTLDLSTNTLTTIDNNDVECFAESEHYIGYFLKDTNTFKYKKKGSADFKSVSIEVGEYNVLRLTLGENSDDTKLAIALDCANSSYTGGSLGVIDLASNTYTQYKTDYHNETEFGYLLNNDIYLINRLGSMYITSNDGVTTSLSSGIYPYYFNVLDDASFDVRGTTNTYGAPSSIYTCEYTPYNFELGLSDTSMNFFAKDNKAMFVVGNYNIGILTEEEYNTALNTAKEIEGSE